PSAYTQWQVDVLRIVAGMVAVAITTVGVIQSLEGQLEDSTALQAHMLLLTEELERRVSERTAQLQAYTHELEAFAYSVSHDLRQPLRGLDGYSLALLEDYGGALDEKAQQYIGRIRQATQQMGQLIDDLPRLSRVTRADL